MERLEDNLLEIALVTYNRPECIKGWLSACLEQIKNRNIRFSVYDSSTNNDTQKIIEEENETSGNYIDYIRIDSTINIGCKALIPMLSSKCRYVWICADRRYHDFEELDKCIFPRIREGKYAYIQLGLESINDPYEKEYTDKSEWFYDNFTGMSCYGLLIYRTDMFKKLKQNKELFNYCEQHFRNDNYGTTFLGYFLTAFAMEDYMAYIHCAKYYALPVSTTTSWHARYYTCTVGDTANLLNNIPDVYTSKLKAMQRALIKNECFSDKMLYKGRIEGDLAQVYEQYKEKGYWQLLTAETDKIEFYAKAPMDAVKEHHFSNIRAGLEECADNELIAEINNVVKDLQNTRNRIYLYGAGYGGKLVQSVLQENSVDIKGYIDKNWEKLKKTDQYDVLWLDNLNPRESVILVCLKKYYRELEADCNKYGFTVGDNLIYPVKEMGGQ